LTTVLWRRLGAGAVGLERCTITERPAGVDLSGIALLALDGKPAEVRWSVGVDHEWVTRRADVHLDVAGSLRVRTLTHDGNGAWQVNGKARPDLDGCLDVDLGITPATNTLPIRRVGDTAAVDAAWVQFPSLDVSRLSQRYERLGERRWRYSSGTFKAMLETTAEGVVVRYQKGWEAVTMSSPR
jgi:hypothetical protein